MVSGVRYTYAFKLETRKLYCILKKKKNKAERALEISTEFHRKIWSDPILLFVTVCDERMSSSENEVFHRVKHGHTCRTYATQTRSSEAITSRKAESEATDVLPITYTRNVRAN